MSLYLGVTRIVSTYSFEIHLSIYLLSFFHLSFVPSLDFKSFLSLSVSFTLFVCLFVFFLIFFLQSFVHARTFSLRSFSSSSIRFGSIIRRTQGKRASTTRKSCLWQRKLLSSFLNSSYAIRLCIYRRLKKETKEVR